VGQRKTSQTARRVRGKIGTSVRKGHMGHRTIQDKDIDTRGKKGQGGVEVQNRAIQGGKKKGKNPGASQTYVGPAQKSQKKGKKPASTRDSVMGSEQKKNFCDFPQQNGDGMKKNPGGQPTKRKNSR